MDVLWKRGASTVGEVHDDLPKRDRVAYSTVLTTLRILEEKGYLDHEQRGRAYVYRPLVARSEARQTGVRLLVNRLFDDSPQALVLNVLENEDFSDEEIAELRRLINRRPK